MHTPTQLLFAARLSCAYLKGEETSSRGTKCLGVIWWTGEGRFGADGVFHSRKIKRNRRPSTCLGSRKPSTPA